MRSIEEIEAFLNQALRTDARQRLLDRGQARAMVRRKGALPEGAQPFATSLDADLAEYGFAVLDAALELRQLDRSHALVRPSFRTAGKVFEALVKHGDPVRDDRGFYRVIAGAAHHLAGYAAVAYALFADIDADALNLNAGEKCLVRFILRDLNAVRQMARDWLADPVHQDGAVAAVLGDEEGDQPEALASVVLSGLFRALASFEFALQTGEEALIEQARRLLDAAFHIADEAGFVTLWWIIRLVKGLLDDLWAQSLHVTIPRAPAGGADEPYEKNRTLFIASLFSRSVSQIELWPSQIKAAQRAADHDDDLVVALLTSAGKTRIAELAALTCLSMGKRVLVVTPLRALSAQTERSFRAAFSPLGATVSSLYGKSGLSTGDQNALVTDEIVVATPEKLDFALRSDPSIIDDIGLIVLDEGHLIGPSEREVRYEILVQKLLRRPDAAERRIVCLSAILPEGDELDDLTGWIRSDAEGEPVRSVWRPTDLRFGTLEWRGAYGALRYDLEDDGPYVPRFLQTMAAIAPEQNARPRDIKDVTLMGAWRFAAEGKRTLIFVTQANWVEGFAKRALDLVRRGYFQTLLDDQADIRDALAIGREWLGPDHPAVAALQIGVAVHHAGLPSPFLREVERLLSSGVISVTIASPTLAQGLNLNAAVLLIPYLVRSGKPISGEEFANVAGRAGRAYVDTEGLVLHVIRDRHAQRKAAWRNLIQALRTRSLKSGVRVVINQVVRRLAARGVPNSQAGYEFLANSREDWLIEPDEPDGEPIEDLIARLDAILLGLVEALDADAENLPELLDEALAGSLWARQMARLDDGVRRMQMIVMKTRARLLWNTTTPIQRKGFYAMGIGLDSGLQIDAIAEDLGQWLDQADLAALQGDLDSLHDAIAELATRLLVIKPFDFSAGLEAYPGWRDVLRQWLHGDSLAEIGKDHVEFIEDALIYRLVWAMEAVRTRRIAHGWAGGDLLNQGAGAACLDTGLPDFRMSMLVRAGLASRIAAKTVVDETEPVFVDRAEMRAWLKSEAIAELSAQPDWPSADTSSLWRRFRDDFLEGRDRSWTIRKNSVNVPLDKLPVGGVFRVVPDGPGHFRAVSADYCALNEVEVNGNISSRGIVFGRSADAGAAIVVYIGPR